MAKSSATTATVSHIDFIMNTKSQHGVLAHFTRKLQAALRKLGIRSTTYDIFKQPLDEICARLARSRPVCTMGFNVVLPESLFFQTLGIPHVSLIVDSATYYPELLRCPNTIASFAEMDSIDFLQSLQKQHLFFLPHAIEKSLAKKKIILKKRIFEVLMPASFIDSEGPFSVLQEHFPKKAVDTFDGIIESCLESRDVNHLTCLKRLFDDNKDLQKMAIDKGISFFDLFSMVELTMRGRDRIRLLKALSDVEVTIACSQNDQKLWKKALGRKRNVAFHDAIDYPELFNAMSQSCFVINSIPTIKRGFHERLFMAACAEAITITNASIFQENYFPENGAVITYIAPHYKEINKKIYYRLNSIKDCKKDLRVLKNIIAKDHTWDARAESLLRILPSLIASLDRPASFIDII